MRYTMLQRAPTRLFCLLEGFFHLTHCISWAFLASILGEKGFSLAEIGTIMMLVAAASAVSTPVWGYLADRTCRLRLLILLNFFAAVVMHTVIAASGLRWLLILMAVLVGAMPNSIMNLCDSWITRLIDAGCPANFGVARAIGSGAYGAISAVLGLLLTRFGLFTTPVLLLAACTVLACIVMMVPDPQPIRTVKADDAGTLSFGTVMRMLLRNSDYMVIVVAYFLVTLAGDAFMTFLPAHIESIGGNQSHLGFAIFFMTVSDVPIMILYRRFEKRFGCWFLLILGFFWIGVRNLMLILSPTPAVLLALSFPGQLLTYGLIVPAMLRCFSEIIDPRCSSSALLLATAVGCSVAQMVGNYGGGLIAELLGTRTMVLCFTPIAFVGGGMLLLHRLYCKKHARAAS